MDLYIPVVLFFDFFDSLDFVDEIRFDLVLCLLIGADRIILISHLLFDADLFSALFIFSIAAHIVVISFLQ